MLRLGGANITSADPAVSSAAKGESLADTIRVISNYADIIVIRHPRDGAARLAAEYSQIPVINGGDGSHEHPTQTLCDLFTLRSKKKSLKNMKVAISGDLKGSRTIHSFVYALARFGATIDPLPAPGMELPAHVDRRLREEFHCRMVSKAPGQPHGGSIDALYVTADQPHQLSLIPIRKSITASWCRKKPTPSMSRASRRNAGPKRSGPIRRSTPNSCGEAKYSDASVMHPLPRVNELDASFDSDRRAIYFQQAAYGVPVRMALISLLLHLHKNKSLHQFDGGFAKPDASGLCAADRRSACNATMPIASRGDPAERQYAANKFYVIAEETPRSAASCAASIAKTTSTTRPPRDFVVADTTRQTYSAGTGALVRAVGRKAPASRHSSQRRATTRTRPAFRPASAGQARAARKLKPAASIERRHACTCTCSFRLRLSVRLDSVRHAADAARRRAGSAHNRLRQYRRDQCAAHRAQGRSPPQRCWATCSRAPWLSSLLDHFIGRECRHHAPRSAHSSATCFRSGSASRAARASRPISGSCSDLRPGLRCWPSARSGSRSRQQPATRRSPR